MRKHITAEHKHLLWQDEINDPFLLTNFCEIYEYNENTISIIVFNSSKLDAVKEIDSRIVFFKADDRLWKGTTNVEDLPKILALNKRRRRIDLEGNNLKKLEKLLGHKILPYNPSLPPDLSGKAKHIKNIDHLKKYWNKGK